MSNNLRKKVLDQLEDDRLEELCETGEELSWWQEHPTPDEIPDIPDNIFDKRSHKKTKMKPVIIKEYLRNGTNPKGILIRKHKEYQ